MYKVIPKHDNVLIQLERFEESKLGQLTLPEEIRKRIRKGVVLAVGEEVEKFKEGDEIIMSFYLGTPVILYENRWLNDCIRLVAERELPAKLEKIEE